MTAIRNPYQWLGWRFCLISGKKEDKGVIGAEANNSVLKSANDGGGVASCDHRSGSLVCTSGENLCCGGIIDKRLGIINNANGNGAS